jgi:ankyrin repeat protein
MKAPSKTALFAAAAAWDVEAVKMLTAAAPKLVRATDPKGRMALHMACASKPAGNKKSRDADGSKTVAALLSAGAELEAFVPMDEDEGDFRANPLWYAVSRGENLALVRFLLKRGAEASYSLWAAVFRDDPVLMRELLKTKPRLDLRSHGETPIFCAARLQRLKTLDLLIEAGADPRIPDDQRRDAVAIARARRLPAAFIERLDRLRQRFERSYRV